MAAFVPAEQTLQLARLIADSTGNDSLVDSVAALIESGDAAGLATAFVKHASALLVLPEQDTELAFNAVVGLVRNVPTGDLESVVSAFLDEFVSAEPERVVIKLRILSTLYNSLSAGAHSRFLVFKQIVRVAADGDELDAVVASLAHLEGWMAEWNLSLADRRELLLLISNELDKSPSHAIEAHEFLLKYLFTFQGHAKDTGATEVKTRASKAIVQAIAIPEILCFEDILSLTAVQALGATKLVELAKIFLDKPLAQYKAFVAKNPKFVKENGLSEEDNVRKMRILTLASLASDNLQGEVAYETIAEMLSISEAEVEFWVIDAIRSGLLDAKINQLEKKILVSRATQRVFAGAQWELLRDRLAAWKSSVSDCLRVIDNSKRAQPAAAAAQ